MLSKMPRKVLQAAAQLLGIAQVFDDQRGQPGALGDQAEVFLMRPGWRPVIGGEGAEQLPRADDRFRPAGGKIADPGQFR